MVSVDSINNNIRVLPRSGGSDTGLHQFTVHGIFPDGSVSSFIFGLKFGPSLDPCDSETLTESYSGPTSYTYTNWGTLETGAVPTSAFSATGSCVIRYETTISPTAPTIIQRRGD